MKHVLKPKTIGFFFVSISIERRLLTHETIMMLAKTSSISVGEKGEKYTLVGRSRAGDGTCFALTELRVSSRIVIGVFLFSVINPSFMRLFFLILFTIVDV